jgi:N-carbamoyl-D-amino-acid hydrolase
MELTIRNALGARFVVFPELALTTFFPRWRMESRTEVDSRYFEKSMPLPPGEAA